MGELVQRIVLSNAMIFLIMATAGFAITIYAFSQREYAGYALGWLAGIFLIMLLSASISTMMPDPNLIPDGSPPQVNFASILVSGVFGLLVSFGAIAAVRVFRIHEYRIVRALTVAGLMCLVLVSGYLMLLSAFTMRLAIAVFVLGVGISLLFYSILARRRSRLAEAADMPEPVDAIPEATVRLPVTPMMNRVERIRQRFRDNRQPVDYIDSP